MANTPKIMQNKTTSKIPKSASQKAKWIKARQLVAKQTGRKSENQPWGLVNKIYQNEVKAGKTIKASDVKKQKVSKTVRGYKKSK